MTLLRPGQSRHRSRCRHAFASHQRRAWRVGRPVRIPVPAWSRLRSLGNTNVIANRVAECRSESRFAKGGSLHVIEGDLNLPRPPTAVYRTLVLQSFDGVHWCCVAGRSVSAGARQLCVKPHHQLCNKCIGSDGRKRFLVMKIRAGKEQSEANVPIYVTDYECLAHRCSSQQGKTGRNAASREEQGGDGYPRADFLCGRSEFHEEDAIKVTSSRPFPRTLRGRRIFLENAGAKCNKAMPIRSGTNCCFAMTNSTLAGETQILRP